MQSNPSAVLPVGDDTLTLEDYGAGHAWLRPVTSQPVSTWAQRDCWPTFVIQTETVYKTSVPSAERALQWFTDPNDIDLVVTLDFGTVEVLGQVDPNHAPDDDEPRYALTEQGRHALAAGSALDKGPSVAEVQSRP